jgi:hypothetical protein
MQNWFCLPNAWLDVQEVHQVFDRLVERLEGHWEDHLDRVPALQRSEQLQAWKLAVEFCYHQCDLIAGMKRGAWRGRLTPIIGCFAIVQRLAGDV